MASKRILWVDAAKAVAIIAIVLCHIFAWFQGANEIASIPHIHEFVQFFYSFHVALFFILSGYTSRSGWLGTKGIKKLAISCWLPYIISGLLIVIVGSIIMPTRTLTEWLAALVYGAGLFPGPTIWGAPFGVQTIGAIWFLPALFFGKIIASAISRIHPIPRIIIAGVLFLVGAGTAGTLFFPFGIQAGLSACWWITCGMMMHEQKMFDSYGWELQLVALCGMIGVAYALLVSLLIIPAPAYAACSYKNGAIDMIGTVCLSITIMAICRAACSTENKIAKAAAFLGRNTLPFFCGHAISLAGEPVTATFVKSFCSLYPNSLVCLCSSIAFIGIAALFCVIVRYIPIINKIYYPELKKPQELGI